MTKVRSSGISAIEHSVTGEKLTLLAVFAHPEDEAFGPTGTLARYASEGVRVSLVTAARDLALLNPRVPESSQISLGGTILPRDKTCSCRVAGLHRVCLDDTTAQLMPTRSEVLEERLVRLIRETQPQVVITYGPNGLSGESEQMLVHRMAMRAFQLAGDTAMFPQHAQDNVYAYQPQKLYYSVLPNSVIHQWGLNGLQGVPDNEITTVLDVSPYSEQKLKAVYCQRHHVVDYTRWLESSRGLQWNEEHFVLALSNLTRRTRKEKDLFAGIR